MSEKKSGEVEKIEPEEAVTAEVEMVKKPSRWLILGKVLGASAAVLTAVTGLVIAVWEPGASKAQKDVDRGYEETARAVNKLKTAVKQIGETQDKLTKRIIFFQAWQEGLNAGKLQAEVDRLQSENAELKGKKASRAGIATKLANLQSKFEAEQKRRKGLMQRQKELLKSMSSSSGQKATQSLKPMPSKIESLP